MARYYRRRYSYRFRYRRSSRRYRTFAKYNYTNLKIDCSFHVQFPGSNGAPQIYFTNSQGGAAQYYSIGDLLKDHSDWTTLRSNYQLYRLRGIRFEATPMSCNASTSQITQSSGVYLGFAYALFPGIDDAGQSWLQYTERSMVLNPLQKVVRYWSCFGAQDDWKTITTDLGGRVAVYSAETATLDTGPIWHVRAIFYMSCKIANK